ncbi:hypothetical protein ER308_12085 [Egibacter rhizosphaerae]|uniref:Uncharacterized protein n=1 Tax=Egibacter rhizosphaerae TaxID=1670831 RepID=A0A411YGM5_9ACTN|nr:hypothetical protein [Egibacter rhizosphaerae]QBI20232.1 hypothetical protein ER308_12085 [Egibacter rhizosphaerae]
MMSLPIMLLLLLMVAGALAPAAQASDREASADESQMTTPATFEGDQIDLAEGWGEARICLVYTEDHIECFGSETDVEQHFEERARAAGIDPDEQPAPQNVGADACPGGWFEDEWFCLYEYRTFNEDAPAGVTPRRLQFQDVGPCQSLSPYGFAEQATSWVNNLSNDTRVFDGADPNCNQTAGFLTLSGEAQSAHLGAWNNRIWSIRILP